MYNATLASLTKVLPAALTTAMTSFPIFTLVGEVDEVDPFHSNLGRLWLTITRLIAIDLLHHLWWISENSGLQWYLFFLSMLLELSTLSMLCFVSLWKSATTVFLCCAVLLVGCFRQWCYCVFIYRLHLSCNDIATGCIYLISSHITDVLTVSPYKITSVMFRLWRPHGR